MYDVVYYINGIIFFVEIFVVFFGGFGIIGGSLFGSIVKIIVGISVFNIGG